MSRLDRLVRATAAHVQDDEGLLASVVGRMAEPRGYVALVATDRRLLVVTSRLGRPTVESLAYADISVFDRQDGPPISVELVALAGRFHIEHIADDAISRVALRLIANRIDRAVHPVSPAATAVAPAVVPLRRPTVPSVER